MATVNRFKATWTGKPPRPYQGQWIVKKNDKDITFFLPTDLQVQPAFTYGEYAVWEENPYAAVQQFVTDGYNVPEWIERNKYWLQLMVDDDQDYQSLYLAFHENDFRTSRYL